MYQELNIEELRKLSGPQVQDRLLAELDKLFEKIEEGTVRDDTFSGCTALGRSDLPPLNDDQSKQIKDALLPKPVSTEPLVKHSVPILNSVFKLLGGLWRSHQAQAIPARNGAESLYLLLDQYGRVRDQHAPPNAGRAHQEAHHQIRETDVNQYLASQPENYDWLIPYTWDIAKRLNAVKQSEKAGDLGLFLERRRKLNVRRPRATRFEQSVQRYAAAISEVFCDEQGNIKDAESLERFIRELVIRLLEKTKSYWAMSPLLAIFDGVVATVMRPLLYKHHTAFFENEVTSAEGVILSSDNVGKIEKLVTTPKWNEASHLLVLGYVKKAFRGQVWSFFLDRFAPYNRQYAKSPHLDVATLNSVGFLTKSFGNPVHLNKVMALLQPTSEEDELAQYVDTHFRSDDFIDH